MKSPFGGRVSMKSGSLLGKSHFKALLRQFKNDLSSERPKPDALLQKAQQPSTPPKHKFQMQPEPSRPKSPLKQPPNNEQSRPAMNQER